jgi:hypothetical protein
MIHSGRRLLGVVGWLVAGVVLVVGVGGERARSQAPFPEGAFVRAQDGTAWVVGNGTRFAIAWFSDDDNLLPSLPTGPTVTTAEQLMAALAQSRSPASSEPPTPQPPPPTPTPPPNPAATLIGQEFAFCQLDTRFTGRVVQAELRPELQGASAPGKVWVIVILNVTNQGTKPENLIHTLRVVDEQGRISEMAGAYPDNIYYFRFARQYNAQDPYNDFPPRRTIRTIAAFFINADAMSLEIMGNDTSCL